MNIQELIDKIKIEKYESPANYFQTGYNSGIERSLEHVKQLSEQHQVIINLDKIKESGFYLVTNNNTTPQHYQGTIQPIDLINAQDLNFNLGNVVKYVCSAGKKEGENILSDLEKAKDYINFEIERVKQ